MRLGWTLLHFLWQGAGVGFFLALVLAVMRNRSSGSRYAATIVALVVLVVFPIVTFLILKPAVVVTSAGGVTTVTQPIFSDASIGGSLASPKSTLETYLPGIVLFWAWGVCVLCIRMLGGLILVERLRKKLSSPATKEWQERLSQLSERIGVKRKVELLQTTHLLEPAAMGVFRATVVIPASLFARLAPEQLEAVLLHELAHIRRHDYLVNLLQTLVEALSFYHPAVWWVSSTIRAEREHCCDDIAVRAMGNPVLYVRALTNLEAERRPSPLPILSALGGTFMNRLTRIIGGEPARPALSPIWLVAAMTAIAGGVVGFTTRAQAQGVTSPPAAIAPAAPTHGTGVGLAAPTAPAPSKKVGANKHAPKAPSAPTHAGNAIPAKAPKAPSPTLPTGAATAPRALPARMPLGGPTMPAVADPSLPAMLPGASENPPSTPRPAGVGAPAKARSGRTHATTPAPPAEMPDRTFGVAADAAPVQGFGGGGAKPDGRVPAQGFSGSVGKTEAAPSQGFGGGSSSDGRMPASVTMSNPERLDVYVKGGDFVETILSATRELHISAVVMPGNYMPLNLTLRNQMGETAIMAICKGANATFRVEAGIYYFMPNEKG